MCSVIFCEAVAIYGVVVAILLATKTETVEMLENGDYPASAKTAGYAIFAAGLTVGMANLVCGYVCDGRSFCSQRLPLFFNSVFHCAKADLEILLLSTGFSDEICLYV